MEVKTKNFYTCKLCGRTSTVEKKIVECENSHVGINEEKSIEMIFGRGKQYPTMIVIEMADGAEAVYFIRTIGKPKESKTNA